MKKILTAMLSLVLMAGASACTGGEEQPKGLLLDFPTLTENYKVFSREYPDDVRLALNTYGMAITEVALVGGGGAEYTYADNTLTLKQGYLSALGDGEKNFVISCGGARAEFTVLVTPKLTQPAFSQSLRLESDIIIRDPFMFRDPKTNVYYLIKSHNAGDEIRVIAYRSYNLKGFSEPVTLFALPARSAAHPDNPVGFWAPELHFYKGRYYIFVTFSYPDSSFTPRQTYMIGADSAEGEYSLAGNMTDPTRFCLDGTLWVENGVPYGVYCDEWATDADKTGTMKYYRLKDDLSGTVGQPKLMFSALDNEINVAGDMRVTDGCFLYRKPDGSLYMLWSTFGSKKYVLTYARSDNGRIDGNWIQATAEQALYAEDGGHGMVFGGRDGRPYAIFHAPNAFPERAVIRELDITLKDGLRLLP